MECGIDKFVKEFESGLKGVRGSKIASSILADLGTLNDTSEYQTNSVYEIGLAKSNEEFEKIKNDSKLSQSKKVEKMSDINTIGKAILSAKKELAKLYPEIKLEFKDDLKDENQTRVIGRAIGKIIEVDSNDVRPDTIPHEYAHIYINTLEKVDSVFDHNGNTIHNLLKDIKRVHDLDEKGAKEFLAKRIGENYVDKGVKKSDKETSLIKSLWEFIIKTFKLIVKPGARSAFKLDRKIKSMSKEFKKGTRKDEVNKELSKMIDIPTEFIDQSKKEPNVEVDSAKSAFLSSAELSKYGTIEDYRKYVDTIFPDSEVKDILAHDTGIGGSMFSADTVDTKFEDSWMYSEDVEITGKGGNYGLVSGEGFYMYKPNKYNEKWDQYSATTGYMKVNMKKPLNSDSTFYKELDGKTYYEKMAKLTNTEEQSNPDEWYMMDNPPEKVTVNSIVNSKTGYDGFINRVRPRLVEYVAWSNDQVHILASKKDVEGFKKYIEENGKVGLGLSENNTALLPVEEPANIDKVLSTEKGFNKKSEFHITVLGFPQGKQLSKVFDKRDSEIGIPGYSKHFVQSLLDKSFKDYELKDEYYRIERDREEFIDWKDKSKGKRNVHEEAIIQLVNAPGLEQVVEEINKEFNIELPIPMPHISLGVKGTKLGIGIPNKKAFDSMKKEKLSTTKPKVEETLYFSDAYSNASKTANKYVADTALLAYKNAESWTGPKLREFHNKRMAENGMYKMVYNTVKDGMAEIELINKIAHTLFLTGDTVRGKIADLTTMVEEVNRWATDTLTDEMPKWDKKLKDAMPDEKDQKLLNKVYGLSGFGVIANYKIGDKTVLELLDEGKSINEIVDELNPSLVEDGLASDLKDRLVHKKVQSTQVANAGFNKKVEVLVVLKTMAENNNEGYKMYQKMKKDHTELHQKLTELANDAYILNGVVNKGIGETVAGKASEKTYEDYEGHGLLDLYSNSHEMKVLTKSEIEDDIYTSKTSPWKVLRQATKDNPGIVIRKSQNVREDGLGVTMDRISNGLYISSDLVNSKIATHGKKWLVDNNIQEYTSKNGGKKYRVILRENEMKDSEGMHNVMQSLYRSNVHNIQLSKFKGLQSTILKNFTEDGTTVVKLKNLEKRIKRNMAKGRKERQEVKPFLNTNLSRDELVKIAPNVAKEYKIARGVTTYGDLNTKIPYVRRGMSDMMVGFQSGSIFKDNWPWLQDIERRYKQLVVLKKLKMVVANPAKLMSDIVSNAAILMALDVDPIEGGEDMKDAALNWEETSKMEAERIRLEMELISAEASNDVKKTKELKYKINRLKTRFEQHEFYDAYKYGFVQSLASSMMIKEYDTISGLQHTIDEVVNKFTKDENQNPNKIHESIVKWMHWGYSVEDILRYGVEKSKLNGTKAGDEINAMADRLASNKEIGKEDVPAYISEIIAGPESETVRQGSRVMQMGDLAARWALYKHTIKEELSERLGRSVTREEVNAVVKGKSKLDAKLIAEVKEVARLRSLDTFVDYRLNIPSELKAGSDLGVLWFPSYWLRNAVVIPQMIAAKPLNSMVSIALSGYTGLPTVYESHPLWKFVNGNLLHAGMDVFTGSTFINPLIPTP